MTEITDEIIDQLAAVRETGAVNMHSKHGVMDVAKQCGFDELVEFTKESSSKQYMEALREMGDQVS